LQKATKVEVDEAIDVALRHFGNLEVDVLAPLLQKEMSEARGALTVENLASNISRTTMWCFGGSTVTQPKAMKLTDFDDMEFRAKRFFKEVMQKQLVTMLYEGRSKFPFVQAWCSAWLTDCGGIANADGSNLNGIGAEYMSSFVIVCKGLGGLQSPEQMAEESILTAAVDISEHGANNLVISTVHDALKATLDWKSLLDAFTNNKVGIR
jgi:hypothetical protein